MESEENQKLLFENNSVEVRPIMEDLTVIIPTLGREILRESLKSIVLGNAWPAELIVVDQGQNPIIAEWLHSLKAWNFKARYIPSTQRGRASAVNRGIENATTRFLAITDDDCLVDPDWIQNMINKIQKNPESIITGRVEGTGEENVVALMSLPTPRIYTRRLIHFDPLCGGNMGVTKQTIEKVGLFDEDSRIQTAEDCELSYRALSSGTWIIYAPEVLVHHIGWRNQKQRFSQYKSYARSHGAFYGKYIKKGDIFILIRIIVHLARALKRWLTGILTLKPEKILRGYAYLTVLIPGIIDGIRSRR